MDTILYPFILIIDFFYSLLYNLTSNYGLSLVLLSFVTSGIMIAIKRLLGRFPEREALVQSILHPQIEKINTESRGIDKHQRIVNLYNRYSYHPILALRSIIPIFIQLPFLFAAYHTLNSYGAFSEISFLTIQDLSQPDTLLSYTGPINFSISILPLLMTCVNIISTFLMPNFNRKSRIQAIVIALFLLVLLYKSSSALLVYWTTNNIIFAFRALYQRIQYNKFTKFNYKIFFSLKVNFDRILNLLVNKKILNLMRIYLSLLVLYVILLNIASGSSLIIQAQNVYFFLLISILLYIMSSQIKIASIKRKRYLFYIINLFVILLPLIIGLFIKKNIYDKQIFLKYLYFTAWAYSLISLFIVKIRINIKKIFSLKKEIILVSLYSLSPAIYLARMNPNYLSGYYYTIFFIIFIGLPFLTLFWVYLFSNASLGKQKASFIASMFVFLFTSLPITRTFYSGNNNDFLDFIFILFIGYILIIHLKSKHFKIVTISGISLLFTVIIGFIFVPINTIENNDYKIAKDDIDVKFSDSCSVYLYVYDGSPNERVYDILNIDTQAIKTVLNKYGFKWYNDTYSLHTGSLRSMSSMLNIAHADGYSEPKMRETYSGNSKVNRVFKENNYKTYKLLKNYYTGNISDYSMKFVDEFYPPRTKLINANKDFFTILLRGVFQGELKFDTHGIKSNVTVEDIQNRKREITLIKDQKKFVVNHIFYPGHTPNSGKITKRDSMEWIKRLHMSYKFMEQDFESIMKNDPNSIIIAIGDHGPFLTGDGYSLKQWEKKDITEDLIWDRVGAFVAIRWPNADKAIKYDEDLVLIQDIFPTIFSYLSDNEKFLSLKPERTFKGFKIIFKEGHLLN